MIQHAFLSLLTFVFLLAQPLCGSEGKRLTVENYFLLVPTGVFDVPPKRLWMWAQKMPGSIFDIANGYVRSDGDGAQGDFEVSLFRFKDDRPLLAICQGDPGEPHNWFLQFFELSDVGQLREAKRSILPPGDQEFLKFELPRRGRTIVVRDTRSQKVTSRWTWNGARFVREK